MESIWRREFSYFYHPTTYQKQSRGKETSVVLSAVALMVGDPIAIFTHF